MQAMVRSQAPASEWREWIGDDPKRRAVALFFLRSVSGLPEFTSGVIYSEAQREHARALHGQLRFVDIDGV